MDITYTDIYRNSNETSSVEDLVAFVLDETTKHGHTEQIHERVENCRKMLAQLVGQLAQKGVLNNDDLNEVISH